jgi:hypothetical protein
MKSLNVQSFALVLCILCSVCVAPVMAADKQSAVVEDGVHFLKFDTSPTKLDPQFYKNMDIGVNFVVDGNQFYWVRIGSVKAADVSSNKLAFLACKGVLIVGAAASAGLIVAVVGAGEATSAGTASPVALPVLFGAISGITAFYADTLTDFCPFVEKWFVDKKFTAVASDGTILLGIKKTNTAGIRELKNSGIDINKLTHLSIEGKVVKTDL